MHNPLSHIEIFFCLTFLLLFIAILLRIILCSVCCLSTCAHQRCATTVWHCQPAMSTPALWGEYSTDCYHLSIIIYRNSIYYYHFTRVRQFAAMNCWIAGELPWIARRSDNLPCNLPAGPWHSPEQFVAARYGSARPGIVWYSPVPSGAAGKIWLACLFVSDQGDLRPGKSA